MNPFTPIVDDMHSETRNVPTQTLQTKRLKEDVSLLGHNPKDPVHTYVGEPILVNTYIQQRNKLGVQMFYGRTELGKRFRQSEYDKINKEMMFHNTDSFLDGVPTSVQRGDVDFDLIRKYPEVVQIDDLTKDEIPSDIQMDLPEFHTAGELVSVAKKNFTQKTQQS